MKIKSFKTYQAVHMNKKPFTFISEAAPSMQLAKLKSLDMSVLEGIGVLVKATGETSEYNTTIIVPFPNVAEMEVLFEKEAKATKVAGKSA